VEQWKVDKELQMKSLVVWKENLQSLFQTPLVQTDDEVLPIGHLL